MELIDVFLNNCGGEIALIKYLFFVMVKDAFDGNPRDKQLALSWIEKDDESKFFNFGNVVEYIFGGEVDADRVRKKILEDIENGDTSSFRTFIRGGDK